jgi:hypothetical protein
MMERPTIQEQIRQRGQDVCAKCGGEGEVAGWEHPDPELCSRVKCPSCAGAGGVTPYTSATDDYNVASMMAERDIAGDPMVRPGEQDKGAREIVKEGELTQVRRYMYIGELRNCLKHLSPDTVAEVIATELPTPEAEAIVLKIRELTR